MRCLTSQSRCSGASLVVHPAAPDLPYGLVEWVTLLILADPEDQFLWLSPALPGRAHDRTAAPHPPHVRKPRRLHHGRPQLPGSGSWPTIGIKRKPPAAPHPHRNCPQPCPGRGASIGRARPCAAEVLADFPEIPGWGVSRRVITYAG
jgi:hypothetical protein